MGWPLRSSAHSVQVALGSASLRSVFSMRPDRPLAPSVMRISALGSLVLSSMLFQVPMGLIWARAGSRNAPNTIAVSACFMMAPVQFV